MADKRIIEQVTSEEILNDDWLIKDSVTEGTTKVQPSTLKEYVNVGMATAQALLSETQERESNDETLSGRITAETEVRTNAVNSLSNRITSEATARENADSTIRRLLGDETTARTSGDNELSGRITSEVTARTNADLTLDNRITNEVNARELADTSLSNRIDSEASTRNTADTTLANNFADEYDASTSYEVGNLCIKDLVLYKCTTATTGTWDDTKWEKITVEEVLDEAGKVDDVQTYGGNTLVTNKIADLSALTIKKSIPSTPTAIATFSDGAEMVMPSLIVGVDAVQDLHGYDSPWAGGSGKNKLQVTAESKTQAGVTYTVNDDGTITVSGTATEYSSLEIGRARVSSSMGNVTISGIANATNIMWAQCNVLDENEQLVVQITGGSQSPSITFDLSSYTNAYYLLVAVKRNSNVATSGTIKPQIEVGSTATTYQPYSNICPISGWSEVEVNVCGKNILDISSIIIGEGVSSTGTFSNASSDYARTTFIRVKPNTTYYYSNLGNVVGWFGKHGAEYSSDDTTTFVRSIGYGGTSSDSFTTSSTTEYVIFNLLSNSTQAQLEEGSESTTYTPYNGQTYTINLGETRYGSEVDVVNGDGTDRLGKIVFDGSESWDIYTASGVNQVYTSVPNAISSASEVRTLCDTYKSISISNRANNFNTCYSGSNSICFNIENVTVAEWKARLQANNVTVVYELATPTTYDTQPTAVKSLVGDNNVFADSGEILEGEYIADASTVIAGLDARITALENA